MLCNDFFHNYSFKNKATPNMKIQLVLQSLILIDVGIYLRDGPITTNVGIVNLHPTKATHWVVYINQNYFDSYGCPSH